MLVQIQAMQLAFFGNAQDAHRVDRVHQHQGHPKRRERDDRAANRLRQE